MSKKVAKSYAQQLQEVVDQYREIHGHDPIDPVEVAAWGLQEKLIEKRPIDIVRLIARDISRAERLERITDNQGRSVRRNHAVRTQQGTLWAEIDYATAEHMQMSAQQRRLQILHDCVQLDTDAASWNENNRQPGERTIQLSLNFEDDVKEMQESAQYDETPPEDDDFGED